MMKKLFASTSSSSNQRSSAPLPLPDATTEQQQQMEEALVFAADHLSEPQKRGLAGLCAWLLRDITDGSRERQWCQQYLALIVERFLALPRSQVDALLPMLTQQQQLEDEHKLPAAKSESRSSRRRDTATDNAALELAPFLELLVPEEAPRRGFRAFFKRTKKDEKQQASNLEPSPAAAAPLSPTPVTTDAFRLKILEKQLWFTVKAIGYDARARVLLRRLAGVMGIEWRLVTLEEVAIGRALFAEATAMPLEKIAAAPSVWDWKRNIAIGAAAVTGGALLAITGGIAAPAIAAGFTALGGAGVAIGTVVGSTAGLHAATILFGTAGAGVVGMKTESRTRGVHEFHFDLVSSGDGMNVYICISGWLDEDDPPAAKGFRRAWGDSREYLRAFYREKNATKVEDVDQVMDRYKGREDEFFDLLCKKYGIPHERNDRGVTSDPLQLLSASRAATYSTASSGGRDSAEMMRAWRWKDRFHQGDQYVLQWEEALLRRFGKSMRTFATQQVMAYANSEIVKYTVLATLFAAVAVPRTILKLADMIDNVWVLAMNAADESGRLLAQLLEKREQGLRPVTLVGYGMGARLIFSCLKELAKKPDECCGIVENAVLLGSPVPASTTDWTNARQVVAGRLINGYSENDWMLGVMYRYQGWALNSAGIAPIDVPGIENANLSSVISGHLEYKNKIGAIMDVLNLDS